MRTWDGRDDSPPTPAEMAFQRATVALSEGGIEGYVVAASSAHLRQQDYARNMSLGERGRLIGALSWLFLWDADRRGIDPYDSWCLLAKYVADGPSPGVSSKLLTEVELERAEELASSRDISR